MINKTAIVIILILIFILFIKCFMSPLGKVVNVKVSNSYFYNRTKTSIFYCPNGNWFSVGQRTLDHVDVKTFQPIAEFIGTDKESVFYENKKQTHVDVVTFAYYKGVMKDIKNVYYVDNSSFLNPELKPIPSAIPKSYELNSKYTEWAKDEEHHFLDGNTITNIDYSSFYIVNRNLFYDKTYFYTLPLNYISNSEKKVAYGLQVIETRTDSVNSINDNYASSGNVVFYCYSNKVEKIYFDKIVSVKEIGFNTIIINNESVLYNGKIFPHNVDVGSFKQLDFLYFTDNKNVYFKDSLMKEIDAKTFEVLIEPNETLSSMYYRDKTHVYFSNIKLPVKDPHNFRYDLAKRRWTDGINYFNGDKILKP